MKKAVLIFLSTLLISTSCSRSASQVWNDTKTAGNYLKKGVQSLWGKGDLSEEYASNEDFFPNFEEEFTPIEEPTLVAIKELPQSNLSPGDQKSGIPTIDEFHQPSNHLSSIFQKVYFSVNNFRIRTQKHQKAVKAIATYLKQHKNVYLFVEGHCCEMGTAQYNLSLGTKRANNTRAELVRLGVDPNRIFTISYGLERPAVPGNSEASWKKNRRVEFKIYTK